MHGALGTNGENHVCISTLTSLAETRLMMPRYPGLPVKVPPPTLFYSSCFPSRILLAKNSKIWAQYSLSKLDYVGFWTATATSHFLRRPLGRLLRPSKSGSHEIPSLPLDQLQPVNALSGAMHGIWTCLPRDIKKREKNNAGTGRVSRRH